MQKILSFIGAVSLLIVLFISEAAAREQVQIAGSSTVLPYAKIVADSFQEAYPKFKTPVIESGGTGAGIKEFCRGVGAQTIDVANASRPMTPAEMKVCFQNGVTDIEEVRFGYDGIVFATDIKGSNWSITPQDVYKALAAQLLIDGKLVNNPYKSWKQINPQFPDWPISVYIPGEKHGTREVFEEKILQQGCQDSGTFQQLKGRAMPEKEIKRACIAVRKDGAAVDIDGDYSETLARIRANPKGMGVFGLAFYENNADSLRVATVNGVAPNAQTIANGTYAVSRPLYFYVKKAHINVIPGLKEYVNFFLSDAMIGKDSPTEDYGLVPAPEQERVEQREKFEKGIIMKMP